MPQHDPELERAAAAFRSRYGGGARTPTLAPIRARPPEDAEESVGPEGDDRRFLKAAAEAYRTRYGQRGLTAEQRESIRAAEAKPKYRSLGRESPSTEAAPRRSVVAPADATAVRAPRRGGINAPLGITALPEPGPVRRFVNAAIGAALGESIVNLGRGRIGNTESPRHRAERLAARAEAGNIVLEEADVKPGLPEMAGELVGGFFDPALLATMTPAAVAAERAVMYPIQALARRPGAAGRAAQAVVRATTSPPGASLGRTVAGRAAHGALVGPGAMAAITTQETIGREGRLPTGEELTHAAKIGLALGPTLAAGFTLAGAGLRATRAPRPPAPEAARAAPPAQPAAEQPSMPAPVPAEIARGPERRQADVPVEAERRISDRRLAQAVTEAQDEMRLMDEAIANVRQTATEQEARVARLSGPEAGGAPPSTTRSTTTTPTGIVRMRTEAIAADPLRFQFKQLGTEGITPELKGVQRWNDKLAGVVSVWRDPADGQVYVVNGHHRLELAKRMDVQEINVQFLDAPDARAARAEGAFINIAEGRGTATDVAKFLRDASETPEGLAARGISLRGDLARNGVALSRLAPDMFDRVAVGEIPQSWGVAIGDMLTDPALQRETLTAVRTAGKRLTEAEVREVARQVRDAGTENVSQETLFGTETERRGLYVQRAQLAAALKKRLAGDRRLFGFVAREGRAEELRRAGETRIDVGAAKTLAEQSTTAEEVFDRLYTRSGPIADLLTEGARRVANGEKPRAVLDELYPAIGDAVDRELAGSRDRPGGVGPDGGERALAGADEAATAGEGLPGERVPDAVDPSQSALFSPARRATPSRAPEAERPALSLTSEPTGPEQGALFGAKAGTTAARNLSQTERAASGELEKLRVQFEGEKNPERRTALATQIADREKLLNRDRAITADELRTQRAAEPAEESPTLPGQLALLSPRTPAVAKQRVQQAMTPEARAGATDLKAIIDIGRRLAEAVQVPLRQGRFRQSARGIFKPHQEVTRVQRFDMLDTVAHEVGHFLSKRYLRNPTMRSDRFRGAGRMPTLLPRDAIRELVQMGKDLYGTKKPAGGYGEEGIAEWVSFYVTEPTTIAQKAPRFTAFMESLFQADDAGRALRAALDQARDDFARFREAPAEAQIDAMIARKIPYRWPTIRGLVKTWLDDVSAFEYAQKDIGATPTPSRDAYLLARASRGAAGAAEDMLDHGVSAWIRSQAAGDRVFRRIAPAVVPALRKVGRARLAEFERYLMAESALERHSNGIDPGIPQAAAEAVATTGRADPVFAESAKAIWQHYNALIDLRQLAGLLTPEEAARIKAKNQRHVGFYREFTPEETAAGRGFGRAFGRSGSGVKRQKGSARKVVPPLESLIKDTHETVQQVRRYDVARELVHTALETEGGGKLIEKVPAPQELIRIQGDELRDQLADLGLVQMIQDAKTGKLEPVALQEGDHLTGQILLYFRDQFMAGAKERKDLVIPILEKGQRQWYALKDRELYDALAGLGTTEMSGVTRWMSLAARSLRLGATLTTEFIARNPFRDAWASAVFSRAATRPPFWRMTEGLFHYLKADEMFQRWKSGGGENSTMQGLDRPKMRRSLDELVRAKTVPGQVLQVVRHPVDTMRMVSAVAENANRIGEYAARERELLRAGAAPQDASTRSTIDARDVSIDFAQAGAIGRQVNQLVAFFNAYTRGQAQMLRELKARPQVVLPRAVAWITAPSIALYLLQRDDPAYRDQPAWKRNTAWLVVQRGLDRTEGWDGYGTGKVEHVWALPKPFELGLLFGTIPERITEWIVERKPETATEMREALTRGMTPPWIPNFMAPMVENYANRSTFTDRPLVPAAREGLDPAEQTTPYTGETARLAGRAVGYSPAKIENLVRGYTGGLGIQALRSVDYTIEQARELAGLSPLQPPTPTAADPLSQVPGLRGFVGREPGGDAESISRIYEEYAAAERHRLTWRAMLKEGRTAEAKQYLARHRDAIVSVATREENGGDPGELRAAHEMLRDFRQVQRTVRGTPAETGVVGAMRRSAAIRQPPGMR